MSVSLSSDREVPGLFHDRTALGILGVSVLLRLLAAVSVGPGFDEAYYHVFSLHLAWGYFDHPPLVAITAGLGRWLTGFQNPLTLRFGAVLFFTVALWGMYDLSYRLAGRRAAYLALLLPHASLFFFAGAGAFVIPDNALLAVWAWSLNIAWRLREGETPRTRGFLLLGLLLGIGLLAKYHAVLLPASLVIASIYDRKLRRWRRDPRLYLALLTAVLVFLPCILWNARNGWISFAEQFGKGTGVGLRLRPDLFGQAVGGQAAYLSPWLMVALWIGAFRGAKRFARSRWLLAFFLVPTGIFTLLGLTRGILPHWPMPGYIAAIVLSAVAFSTARKVFLWTWIGVGLNLLIVGLIVIQARFGVLPLPEKSDPTLDPVGWRETIEWLEVEGYLSDTDILFVHKWFTGGELVWADRNRHPVVNIGGKPHGFAWWSPPERYRGASGWFITQARYGLSDNDIRTMLHERFVEVTPVFPPPVKRGRGRVKMLVWRVEALTSPPEQPYGPAASE